MIFKQKYIGSLFLMAAGMLFMVHSAIPHHHHVHQVCIENYGVPGHEPHHSGCDGDEGNHGNGSETSQCVLNQFIVVPGNSTKLTYGLTSNAGEKAPDTSLTSTTNAIYQYRIGCSLLRILPISPTLYSLPVQDFAGKRAPPSFSECILFRFI